MIFKKVFNSLSLTPKFSMFSEARFDQFGLHSTIAQSLKKLGITKMTNIQNLSFKSISEGKDSFIQAETGSGKTFAYAIPIMNKVLQEQLKSSSIILAPTKEYCQQIHHQLQSLNSTLKIQRTGQLSQKIASTNDDFVNVIDFKQLNILITTPTQLNIILETQKLKISTQINSLVIDEFDIQMNDQNLAKATKKLLLQFKKNTQLILSCASAPKRVYDLQLEKYLEKFYPKMVIFKTDDYMQISKNLKHEVIELLDNENELNCLMSILQKKSDQVYMIFAQSKERVEMVTEYLKKKNFNVKGFYSQLKVQERMNILEDFQSKNFKFYFKLFNSSVLVTTDALSRGFDFLDVKHVIQFDFASDAVSFLHRVGRTARAGQKGEVTSIVKKEDQFLWQQIQLVLKEKHGFEKIISRKRSLSKGIKKKQIIQNQDADIEIEN